MQGGRYEVRGLSTWTKIRIDATNGATVTVGATYRQSPAPHGIQIAGMDAGAPGSGPTTPIYASVSNTGDLIGTVTLTRSTVGTGNFLANAVAVTYTIQVNGTESGVTIFADVSNADTMPPVTDAKQWETLTPNGLVPVARPASTLGSVGNNTFYANGYRWMKWRAEAWCPTCGPTVAVMYKAVLP